MIVIRQDDLSGEATRALAALHLAGMHASSPPGHVFALDLSGLQAPGVTLWSAWDGDAIAGIGALKALADDCADDKVYEFMFVAPAIPITGAVGSPTNPLAIK